MFLLTKNNLVSEKIPVVINNDGFKIDNLAVSFESNRKDIEQIMSEYSPKYSKANKDFYFDGNLILEYSNNKIS